MVRAPKLGRAQPLGPPGAGGLPLAALQCAALTSIPHERRRGYGSEMVHGVIRVSNGRGDQHSVVVDYGRERHEVPEDVYRADGYEPPFDHLPWKEDPQAESPQAR